MVSTRAPRWSEMALAVATVGTAVLATPGQAHEVVRKFNQAEARDPSGKITVEASVITVIRCNGQGENGGEYYLYQYTNRPGFRAIKPPNWGSPIGGEDFETFNEAALAACADL